MSVIHFKLFFIRKIKALFSRYKLHIVTRPFEGIFQNLLYLSKLSKWINDNKKLSFNDFYNSKVLYTNRFNLHQYVIDSEIKNNPIDYLEFGVASGIAFRWWVDKIINPDSRFYGFDVFTGLPENFGVMKKHHYDTEGNTPRINDNRVTFISGMFQDSLPNFLTNYKSDQRKIIHMDADLYSSTLFVLTTLIPYLQKNDIIIFDEFGVPTHEFRAFQDIIASYKLNFEPLGAINNYLQVAFKIV